jgi:ABC-type bacteriocin/lantibiotic exporter with double-glycine peptidase domain
MDIMNRGLASKAPLRPTPLRRARQLLALDRQDIAVIVVYGVALGLLSLAVPVAVQSLVNTVAFGSLIQPLVVLTVLLAVALTGAAILRALQVRVAEMLQRRLFVRIVTEIGARLPRVSGTALRDANGPELLNRFFDVFTIQKSVAALLLGGVDAVLIALVGLIVLAFYHPALLAFDLVLIVGAVLVLIPLGRGGTGTSVAESKAKYAVAGWLEEMARHPLSFKLAGGEQLARTQVETLAKSYLDKRDRHFRIVFRQLIGAFSIEVIASVALLAVGGLLVIERQLSIGQLVAAELIVTAVVASIAKLGGKVETFYDLVAAVDKLGEILDLPLERPDGEILPPDSGATLGLVLENVEVDREDDLDPLHVSLRVEPGERVSIDGTERDTAALVDSIFGLRSPSAGVIEMDGHDVRDLALRELRSRVSLVRGAEIFSGSVLDNLRVANPELTAEQAWEALGRVGLAAAVKSLPSGLQTPILRDGAPLSRSQGIALTIARAVAGKPSLLILDRTLDRIDPDAGIRIADCLSAMRDSSLLIVSEDSAIGRRMDRQLHIPDSIKQEGEAA